MEAPILVGEVFRQEIEALMPSWVEEAAAAEIDPRAVAALSELEGGDTVAVFFATWCSDSRREIGRLWRILDSMPSAPPFTVRYLGVDRSKSTADLPLSGFELARVPTFVVLHAGEESGRIIETSPNGLESDLLALLSGEATGWITASEDLIQELEAKEK
jgi:hypothetical protein